MCLEVAKLGNIIFLKHLPILAMLLNFQKWQHYVCVIVAKPGNDIYQIRQPFDISKSGQLCMPNVANYCCFQKWQ